MNYLVKWQTCGCRSVVGKQSYHFVMSLVESKYQLFSLMITMGHILVSFQYLMTHCDNLTPIDQISPKFIYLRRVYVWFWYVYMSISIRFGIVKKYFFTTGLFT